MLYIDYTKLVLKVYENKRDGGKLSSRLSHPSPAELRDECEAVCEERYNDKDAVILKTFFGAFKDKDEAIQNIRNHDINRFKPLANFLKGEIQEPKKKNIDLLAWLINVEPRPFEQGKHYNALEDSQTTITETEKYNCNTEKNEIVFSGTGQPDKIFVNPNERQSTGITEPGADSIKPSFYFKKYKVTISVILLLLAGGLIYWGVTNKKIPGPMEYSLSINNGCMYWTGDHYEPIPCNQKVYGTLVVALDSQKLLHFKKITKPDTLTEADINKVFYIKYNGKIEFYTGNGEHPVYTERSLKPLTEYIYIHQILPLKQQ